MNLIFFATLLFSLQLLYWFVGKRSTQKVDTTEDYFLAGKSVRFFPLMMTFLATQVGGGIVLGSAEEAYKFGWSVIFYPVGTALGLVLLGAGLGRKLAQFQVSTVAQLFETLYNSTRLRKIASLLSVISLFMILVAQIIASHKFLVSLGFNNTPLFIVFWAIVILYTCQGGLRAVISTDLVQALFFTAVFAFCFGFALFGGLPTDYSFFDFSALGEVSSKLSGWLLMPLLFMVIEQDMGQRCFAGDSPRTVSRAAFFAGLATLAIAIIPIFFGTLAKSIELEIPEGASVLMTVIAKMTNPWITALVGCAVIAAIISTATSLINAISSNLSSDFDFAIFKRDNAVKIIKGMTSLLCVGAIFFAFAFDNIVDLMIQSYELSISCLFVPIFVALFTRKGAAEAAWGALVFGCLSFILFRIVPLPFSREIASIVMSAVGYGIGAAFATYRYRLSEVKG